MQQNVTNSGLTVNLIPCISTDIVHTAQSLFDFVNIFATA